MDVDYERPIVVLSVLDRPYRAVNAARIFPALNERVNGLSLIFASSRLPGLIRIRSLDSARRVVIDRVRIAVSFPRGRGRITMSGGRAIIVARCPLCGEEHRYDKGEAIGEEVEAIRRRGYTEEWLPCQKDLPGNFWRVVITSARQGGRPDAARRARDAKTR